MDIITPALGAIVGFSLAQFANLAQLIFANRTAAKLKIDDLGTGCRSLIHRLPDNPEVMERVYAFGVQNVGKRVAASVRFQLVKIEFRTEKNSSEFDITSHSALELSINDGGGQEVTLVPGARVEVRLAVSRSDTNIISPAVSRDPFAYYGDLAPHVFDYRLTVVSFDSDGHFASATFPLTPKWR